MEDAHSVAVSAGDTEVIAFAQCMNICTRCMGVALLLPVPLVPFFLLPVLLKTQNGFQLSVTILELTANTILLMLK